MSKLLPLLLAGVSLFLPGAALGQVFEVQSANTVNITEITENNLLVAGSTVQLNSIVTGDAVIFGSSVLINGDIYEDAWIAASTLIVNGEIQDDLRVAASSVIINEAIAGDVFIASSDSTLNSTIGGNVQILGSTLVLGENAQIDGNLLISSDIVAGLAGKNAQSYASQVTGTVSVLEMSTSAGSLDPKEHGEQGEEGFGLSGFSWFGLLSKTGIAALLIAFLGRFLAPIATTAIKKPGYSLLTGLGYFIGFPILGGVLLLTGIFAPLAGLVFADYIFAWIFLSVMVAAVMAAYFVREYCTDTPQLQTRRGTTIVACLILALLQIVPGVVTTMLGVLVVGAMILYFWTMRTFLKKE